MRNCRKVQKPPLEIKKETVFKVRKLNFQVL